MININNVDSNITSTFIDTSLGRMTIIFDRNSSPYPLAKVQEPYRNEIEFSVAFKQVDNEITKMIDFLSSTFINRDH